MAKLPFAPAIRSSLVQKILPAREQTRQQDGKSGRMIRAVLIGRTLFEVNQKQGKSMCGSGHKCTLGIDRKVALNYFTVIDIA